MHFDGKTFADKLRQRFKNIRQIGLEYKMLNTLYDREISKRVLIYPANVFFLAGKNCLASIQV